MGVYGCNMGKKNNAQVGEKVFVRMNGVGEWLGLSYWGAGKRRGGSLWRTVTEWASLNKAECMLG